MVLVPAQVQDNNDNGVDVLQQLMALITGKEIRSTHKFRLERRKTTPVWFALPRSRRSFAAVLLLANICTTEHLNELLRRRWIATSELKAFMERTPLSEGHRAIIERVIRLEDQRVEAHTGTGTTGELRVIADGGASHELRATVGGPARYRRGQRVFATR